MRADEIGQACEAAPVPPRLPVEHCVRLRIKASRGRPGEIDYEHAIDPGPFERRHFLACVRCRGQARLCVDHRQPARGAGTTSEIVGKIPGGSLVDSGDCTDGWCAITWQEKSGFAIQSALDLSGRVPQRAAGPRANGPPSGYVAVAPPSGYVPVGPPVYYEDGPPGYYDTAPIGGVGYWRY